MQNKLGLLRCLLFSNFHIVGVCSVGGYLLGVCSKGSCKVGFCAGFVSHRLFQYYNIDVRGV